MRPDHTGKGFFGVPIGRDDTDDTPPFSEAAVIAAAAAAREWSRLDAGGVVAAESEPKLLHPLEPPADAFEVALTHFCSAQASALQTLRAEMLRIHRNHGKSELICARGEDGSKGGNSRQDKMEVGCGCPGLDESFIKDCSPFSDQSSELRVAAASEQAPASRSSHGSIGDRFANLVGSPGSEKLRFSMAGKTKVMTEQNSLGFLERVVSSPAFDFCFVALISCNCLVMAFEAQWNGLKKGAEVNFNGYKDPDWVHAEEVFGMLEFGFGFLFAFELVLKVGVFRTKVWRNPWTLLDGAVALAWVLSLSDVVVTQMHPSLLRMVRLVRLLRLVRLVRTMKGFDALLIMTTAMRGSMSILFWTMVVLTVVLMLCAMVLQAACENYVVSDAPVDSREEVFVFYGTFSRCLLTMFEITLGNWMPPCRALVENVNEWFMVFFVLHKLIIGFSVLAVMNGVFMQETFKVASSDDHIMIVQRERAADLHTRKIRALFEHLDDNGDGCVTAEEFQACVTDPAVRRWLSAMELEVRDVDSVFRLLDADGTHRLSAEDLVTGVSRLKGQARSIDLATLILETRENQNKWQKNSRLAKELRKRPSS